MSNEGLNLPEIDIDLSSDEIRAFGGGGGPMLPIGTYTMDIVSAEQTTSKKNQPVAKVTFKVADEGDQFGVELPKSYSLQTQALGRIKKLMIAAGARLDKIRLGELVGARVIVEVIHTEASGQVDAQGNVMPGRMLCDITNEEAIAEPEAAPTPPPAVRGKAVAVQQAAPAPVGNKNGSVARRA
jgi:hypothetical protein